MPRLTAPIALFCAGITAACAWLPWYSEEGGDEWMAVIYLTTGFGRRFHGSFVAALAIAAVFAAAISWVGGERARGVAIAWARVSRAAIATAAFVTLFDLLRTAFNDWWDEDLGITTGWIGPGIYLTLVASVVGTVLASLRVAEVRASNVEPSSA